MSVRDHPHGLPPQSSPTTGARPVSFVHRLSAPEFHPSVLCEPNMMAYNWPTHTALTMPTNPSSADGTPYRVLSGSFPGIPYSHPGSWNPNPNDGYQSRMGSSDPTLACGYVHRQPLYATNLVSYAGAPLPLPSAVVYSGREFMGPRSQSSSHSTNSSLLPPPPQSMLATSPQPDPRTQQKARERRNAQRTEKKTKKSKHGNANTNTVKGVEGEGSKEPTAVGKCSPTVSPTILKSTDRSSKSYRAALETVPTVSSNEDVRPTSAIVRSKSRERSDSVQTPLAPIIPPKPLSFAAVVSLPKSIVSSTPPAAALKSEPSASPAAITTAADDRKAGPSKTAPAIVSESSDGAQRRSRSAHTKTHNRAPAKPPQKGGTSIPSVRKARSHSVPVSKKKVVLISDPTAKSAGECLKRKGRVSTMKKYILADRAAAIPPVPEVSSVVHDGSDDPREISPSREMSDNDEDSTDGDADDDGAHTGSIASLANQIDRLDVSRAPNPSTGKVPPPPNKNQKKPRFVNVVEANRVTTEFSEFVSEFPNLDWNISRGIKAREYCNQLYSVDLETVIKEGLKKLLYFQNRAIVETPAKAKLRRRFISGFRQVINSLLSGKLKLVIIVPDVEPVPTLNLLVFRTLKLASIQRVPVVFAYDRRRISRVLDRCSVSSVIGVMMYDGAFDEMKKLDILAEEKRKEFESLYPERATRLRTILASGPPEKLLVR